MYEKLKGAVWYTADRDKAITAVEKNSQHWHRSLLKDAREAAAVYL